ncbi:SpoIIE family protein phosphatase [Bacillus sp. BGMRC 2118]|nr:SpoIIE family protein phosphatase [Bacillus sp. BGMRC 2118]
MSNYKQKFVQAAHKVFELLRATVPARTFFIATTSNEKFHILVKFNSVGGCTIPENVNAPLHTSYCSFVAMEAKPLLISDTGQSELVRDMKVTSEFSIGSYLGVPIFLEDGSIFGTLCALDPMPHILEEKHTKILEGFAGLISNAIELEKTIRDLRKHELQTENEFLLAQRVQKTLFSQPLQKEAIQVSTIHLPSTHLSGDLFTWQKLDDQKYGIIILDVMGHDVSSALIGMMVFSQVKNHMATFKTPYEVMKALNLDVINFFNDTNDFGAFVTGIYVVLDLKEQLLTYMNAGHPPAILIQNNHTEFLSSANLPLGITDVFPDSSKTSSLIDQQFNLLLYTDGLLDILKPKGETVLHELQEEVEKSLITRTPITNYFEKKISTLEKHPDDICILSILANDRRG